MRKAEEWVKIEPFQLNYCPSDRELVAIIKRIQLDAFKAGAKMVTKVNQEAFNLILPQIDFENELQSIDSFKIEDMECAIKGL